MNKEMTFRPINKIELKEAIKDFQGKKGEYKKRGHPNNWDTSKITDMSCLFEFDCSFNECIDNWDTSNVTNMEKMFFGAELFNKSLGNIKNLIDTRIAFTLTQYKIVQSKKSNRRIKRKIPVFLIRKIMTFIGSKSWDTSRVTNMKGMFYGALQFNQPISHFNTCRVEDMKYMFCNAREFNHPIERWDTSKVTDMNSMFSGASSFNQHIGNWDTGKVTDMSTMFLGATLFNQPIGRWDITKVTDMCKMFYGTKSFNQTLTSWNTINVQDMWSIFEDTSLPEDKQCKISESHKAQERRINRKFEEAFMCFDFDY